MLKIESKCATIEFTHNGAEMTSFKSKDSDFEYLWQPQEGFWQGRNPILFPIVGSTFDKKLHIDGKEYEIGNHGFCRNMAFKVVEQKENEITFELCDTKDTLLSYPYRFNLQVTYTLNKKEVTISYVVKNKNDKMMPFTFGLHPAFTCPFEKDQVLEDTYLKFSNNDKQACLNNIEWTDTKKIQLSKQLFSECKTLIFENHLSTVVELSNGNKGVRVTAAGYRWLAFWKQPESKFVCIEPWHGHTDFNEEVVEFKNRDGMIHLDANRSFTTQYKIEIF